MLTGPRHEVSADPLEFTRFATERGWGDGLPVIPPTPARVEEHVAASGLPADTILALIPPYNGECTVERLATNAVLAGARPDAMPVLVAAVRAMADPDFELGSLNVTTGSVVPAVIVNGPVRDRLGIATGPSCLGGADGPNAPIGRALRLVMRNVGGQRAGVTSQSVFGQPGRISGIVFGEWEERSPWPPLARRRGVAGDAVTVFGAMGTMSIHDHISDRADLLLGMIGRSVAYQGANGFRAGLPFSELVVGVNPVWAELIATDMPDVAEVEDHIWRAAHTRMADWPEGYQRSFEEFGHVTEDGTVPLVKDHPGHIFVVVCGGLGGLHGFALHGIGTSSAITRPVGTEATWS
jgi:hypothetical protein